MKAPVEDDRLDCWDPANRETFLDLAQAPSAAEEIRKQTGLCGESQADGVPCTSPKTLCELCGHAH